jgi:hypothetical protein
MDEPLAIAQKILNFVDSVECVAWIGAGFSALEYPSWKQLITDLCIGCGIDPPTSDKPEELINKAQQCKECNPDTYRTILYKSFEEPRSIPRNYLYITKLSFQGYVTTNYDPLLSLAIQESILESNIYNIYYYPSLRFDKLNNRETSVYYIHGAINADRDLNIVLTKDEFDNAYGVAGMTNSFLVQLFTFKNILFLGCRLSEAEIDFTLSRVHSIQEQIEATFGPGLRIPKKIILLPAQIATIGKEEQRNYDNEQDEEERLCSLGFEVIRYKPGDNYSQLDIIIKNMCELANITKRPRCSHGFEEDVVRP